MKYSTIVLASLVALPINAYVHTWNDRESPAQTLRRLERRADTCPSDRPVSCQTADAALPSNFCCESGTTCHSIDRSSSAICCPTGSNCDSITTISCDVSLQDASTNKGPIFTTKTSQKLSTCGDECCPFGYTCTEINGNSACALDKVNAGPASTILTTSTTISTATLTPTALASGIDSNNPPPAKENNSFPAGVFFAGLFPGIVVGILATLAWVVLTKRNNKPVETRGLNHGTGNRPMISLPVNNSVERTDFAARTRSRARSMFSSHRRTQTVDTPDFWAHKMPTPPPNNNVPINYLNSMPDVPVTPARRVARYHSDNDVSRSSVVDSDRRDSTPVGPDEHHDAPAMPQPPIAAIPPLRGMNTQRRISPDYGMAAAHEQPRRDSGTAMGNFGSPFRTPEKKPVVATNNTPSMYATYHDTTKADSPEDHSSIPQTLTPARYDPKNNLAPSAAATLASSRLSKAQRDLPSQQSKPVIPPRPQGKPTRPPRPETQCSDFDFDNGIEEEVESPTRPYSPPREAYKSQAVSNPYGPPQANPDATFESWVPAAPSSQFDKVKKDKHATNATTFTTMLRNVGFPDYGSQIAPGTAGVPKVPKLDLKKVGAGKKKGMI